MLSLRTDWRSARPCWPFSPLSSDLMRDDERTSRYRLSWSWVGRMKTVNSTARDDELDQGGSSASRRRGRGAHIWAGGA